MKLCNNCGTPLKDTDAFCRKCGQKVGGTSPEPTVQTEQVNKSTTEASSTKRTFPTTFTLINKLNVLAMASFLIGVTWLALPLPLTILSILF